MAAESEIGRVPSRRPIRRSAEEALPPFIPAAFVSFGKGKEVTATGAVSGGQVCTAKGALPHRGQVSSPRTVPIRRFPSDGGTTPTAPITAAAVPRHINAIFIKVLRENCAPGGLPRDIVMPAVRDDRKVFAIREDEIRSGTSSSEGGVLVTVVD